MSLLYEPWRIELFGGLRVIQGDRVLTRFRTRKTAVLLATLVFYSERSHPREELIELLWPEAEPTLGQRSLRTALSSLRHQLEPPGVASGAVIIADRSSVRLNPEAVVTDVAQFEAAWAAAIPLDGSTGGRTGAEAVLLSEAVELYQGELLPGFFEEWGLQERRRLALAVTGGQ
jgi:DNA-binding SARP family transcriptional activator